MRPQLPPLNRLLAFFGPIISVATGGVTAWLFVHIEILGALGFNRSEVAMLLAWLITGGLTAILTHTGIMKWLDGHQIYFCRVFDLVKELDPQMQSHVLAALPLVRGDIITALNHAFAPSAASAPTAVLGPPVEPPFDPAGDGSGDTSSATLESEVTQPPLDNPPTAVGDQAVHAPQPTAPPATPAAPTAGGAA
jgi:hypothetical protein